MEVSERDLSTTGDALNQLQTAILRSVSSRREQEFEDKLQLALTQMNTVELHMGMIDASIKDGPDFETRVKNLNHDCHLINADVLSLFTNVPWLMLYTPD
ncbi:hypothetical protein GJ496_006858 [Pomphorhynchus laevis]|nr:hypothetical protein GJ496_006858 [Pomphorhynchus laevis]